MGYPSSENVRLGFYFADLIFVVCQSTAKTAKIGSLEISGYTAVHVIYSIVIYSSTNFGYTECSRSSVRYTCFVQYSSIE